MLCTSYLELTVYRKLFSVVTLLQTKDIPVFRLSLLCLLTSTLPGYSASEVTTLWRYTNLYYYYYYCCYFSPPAQSRRQENHA